MRFFRNFMVALVVSAVAFGILATLILPPIIMVIVEAAMLIFLGGIILCRW